ncbi:hypothetical protein AB0H43_03135 [Hamadaea sp. NPDC050747]|uniref:hypothetical protein n=1 Tax=Hamadaea sp. NPDC050747 TaxID=3155789 RepID=UPI0033D23B23
MTTPGDECGVKGGCPACPLFVHNICGDPAPTVSIAIDGYDAVNDAELPGMWEAADFMGGLDVVRPAQVCVQTRTGVVPCGHSALATSREAVAALRVSRMSGGRLLMVENDEAGAFHPDAPDVDPDEPLPIGGGCCGGACGD